jgi:hypothetical protein
MGFAANQARLMGLISRRYDLELEGMFLEQHKMYLANLTSGLFNMQAKLEPGSQAAKILEARIRQLSEADKMLDIQLKRITSQREAVVKEIDSTEKLINKNIESSFGIMAR